MGRDLLALAAAALVVAGCPRPHPEPAAVAACPAARELLVQATAAEAEGHAFRVLALARRADQACSSDVTRARVAAAQAQLGSGSGTRAPSLDARVADRLAGHPGHAIDALRARENALDATSLVELGRDHEALGHSQLAQLQFERAAARAEAAAPDAQGSWRLPHAARDATIKVVVMADGAHVVTGDREGLIRMWDLSSGAEVWSAHEKWPSILDVSPDGKLLVIDTNEGLRLLRAATGERVLELTEVGLAAQFGPDDHLFAVRLDHSGYDEIEVPSGRVVAHVKTATWARNLTVSHDRVLTIEEDPHQRNAYNTLIRNRAGVVLSTFPTSWIAWNAHLFPSGRYVLELNSLIELHDATGKLAFSFPGARPAYSAGGGELAMIDAAGAVAVYDVATGAQIRTIDPASPPSGGAGRDDVVAAFAAEPGVLITAGYDDVSTWDLATGKRTSRVASTSAAEAVAFDAAGTRLAIGGSNGQAVVWDLASGRATSFAPRPGKPVTTLAFGEHDSIAVGTGRVLLSLYSYQGKPSPPNSTITSWDLAANRARWSIDVEGLTWLAMRPGHDELAANAMVPVNGGRQRGVVRVDGAGVVTPLPDAGVAYGWTPDGSALVRDVGADLSLVPADGGAARVLLAQNQTWRVANVELSADGATAAVDVGTGRLALWDLASGEPTSIVFDDGPITGLAWSPAKSATSFVATAVGDRVHLWDRRGARLASLVAHARVTGLAFRPDGRVLAVACDDGGVELWAVAGATRLVTLLAPGGDADHDRALVLAGDGRVDGDLGDGAGVALAWQVGAVSLPARAVWDRARTPHLLATLLAAVPAQDVPRANLSGAEAPPAPTACVAPPRADTSPSVTSSRAVDDHTIDLCIDRSVGVDDSAPPPTCFQLDLATGVHHPRAATPREVLELPKPADAPTITVGPDRVDLCHGARCEAIPTPEMATRPAVDTNDPRYVWSTTALDAAGTTLAIATFTKPVVGVLYDVATRKAIGRFGSPDTDGALDLSFLGATLLVTSTPCAGPCSRSDLVSRTGKVLAEVPVNTSTLHAAQVDGDVWAFNDWDVPRIVYQDIKTGRVVHTVELPRACDESNKGKECDAIDMHHVAGGVAVVSLSGHAGQVRVLDAKGALVATHDVPTCK